MRAGFEFVHREKDQRCAGVARYQVFFAFDFGCRKCADRCERLIFTVRGVVDFQRRLILLAGKRKRNAPES
ncbi:hypothetical protein D3C86_1898400 [compost metagenome]